MKQQYPDFVGTGKDLFDASVFRHDYNRKVFYYFISKLKELTDNSTPTPTHHFIKTLDEKKKLLRCYTQNIDCFEDRLGMNTDIDDTQKVRVVQLHGEFNNVRCTICVYKAELTETVQVQFKEGETVPCPGCEETQALRKELGKRPTGMGYLRPNITLYNEPSKHETQIGDINMSDLKKKPDLLIIMGTSLKVFGLKNLIKDFAATVHQLKAGKVMFFNKTTVGMKEWEDIIDYVVLDEADKIVNIIEKDLETLEKKSTATKERASRVKAEKGTFICHSFTRNYTDAASENVPVKGPVQTKLSFPTIKTTKKNIEKKEDKPTSPRSPAEKPAALSPRSIIFAPVAELKKAVVPLTSKARSRSDEKKATKETPLRNARSASDPPSAKVVKPITSFLKKSKSSTKAVAEKKASETTLHEEETVVEVKN